MASRPQSGSKMKCLGLLGLRPSHLPEFVEFGDLDIILVDTSEPKASVIIIYILCDLIENLISVFHPSRTTLTVSHSALS